MPGHMGQRGLEIRIASGLEGPPQEIGHGRAQGDRRDRRSIMERETGERSLIGIRACMYICTYIQTYRHVPAKS